MKRGDRYYWRLIATGLCFLIFGLGGFLLSLAAFAMRAWPQDDAARGRRMRKLISAAFKLFAWLMQALGVLRYDLHGLDRLGEPGQLIVASHPSLIDVIFLIAYVPDAICVVKQPLLDGRLFGPLLRGAEYVGNDSAEASIGACAARLDAGISVILFPEGTRTPRDAPIKLRRGAAYVAMAAGAPLVPVRIRVQPPTLGKRESWYHIPDRRFHFEMHVGDAITPSIGGTRTITARTLTNLIHERLWGDTNVYA